MRTYESGTRRMKALTGNEERKAKMEKRITITLRTKIYLTIAGLLTMVGMLYGVTAIPFAFDGPAGVQGPVGVAAAPADLFISDFCAQPDLPARQLIRRVECDGTLSEYASIPVDFPNSCSEKYMALA